MLVRAPSALERSHSNKPRMPQRIIDEAIGPKRFEQARQSRPSQPQRSMRQASSAPRVDRLIKTSASNLTTTYNVQAVRSSCSCDQNSWPRASLAEATQLVPSMSTN